MAAPRDELEWQEFSDFTGGLWETNPPASLAPNTTDTSQYAQRVVSGERGDRSVPANGLLECEDCYPVAAGGLRAFAKSSPVGHGGLTTNSIVLALRKLTGLPGNQGVLCLATVTMDAGGAGIHTLRLLSNASQLAISDADVIAETWTELRAQTGVAAFDNSVNFVSYYTDPLGYRAYVNLPILSTTLTTGTTMPGIWRLEQTGTAMSGSTRVQVPEAPAFVHVHQRRMVYPIRDANTPQYTALIFTEPESDTQASSNNFLFMLHDQAHPLVWANAIAPSDLILGRQHSGVVLLQGDMTNPLIREMTFGGTNFFMSPVTTPIGLVYTNMNNGVYVWSAGGERKISDALSGSPNNPGLPPVSFQSIRSSHQKLGAMGYGGHFVFAGNGYIWDTRTEAWFRSSEMNARRAKHFSLDPFNYRMFWSSNDVWDGGNGNEVLWFLRTEEDMWTAVSSYRFMLPVIYRQGRQIVLRELEFHLQNFERQSRVKVTVIQGGNQDSDPVSTVLPEAVLSSVGPQKVRLQVGKTSDWFLVRVEVIAPTLEAPMLERMFAGIQQTTTYRDARRN